MLDTILVIDSGLGGKDYIEKLKKLHVHDSSDRVKYKCKLIKPFEHMVSSYDKKYVRDNLMALLEKYTKNTNPNVKIHSVVIACHSASSCILDILIKNNFMLNKVKIYEPIVPLCLFIQQNNTYENKKNKKYKNILILCTPLTQKIRWHERLIMQLNGANMNVHYIGFPFLAEQLEKNIDYHASLDKLKTKQTFIPRCDCVVLGCTHFNTIKDELHQELVKKYNFKGIILDSNAVLSNFLYTII